MRTQEIKRIAGRISRQFGMVDKTGKPLVCIDKGRYDYGLHYADIRTELTSYEGGFELVETLIAKGYVVEAQGGCVYRVFTKKEVDEI